MIEGFTIYVIHATLGGFNTEVWKLPYKEFKKERAFTRTRT
jgi:hypothetical protein